MNKSQLLIFQQVMESVNRIDSMEMSVQNKGTCYLALAYELFEINQPDLGLKLIQKVPEIYFDSFFQKELENPDFLEIIMMLIDNLMKSPLVDKDIEMKKIYFNLKNK